MLPETPSLQPCPPALARRPCSWEQSLWGCPSGVLRGPWMPAAPKAPYQSPPPQSLPAPGRAVKTQQCRMGPGVLGLLCLGDVEKSHGHEQPLTTKHRPQPLARAPACRRWYISLFRGRAPSLSFQRPSVRPCMARGCCPAFSLLLYVSLCPGATFHGRSWRGPHRGGLSPSCVMDTCGVCLAQGFPRSPKFSFLGRAGQLLTL